MTECIAGYPSSTLEKYVYNASVFVFDCKSAADLQSILDNPNFRNIKITIQYERESNKEEMREYLKRTCSPEHIEKWIEKYEQFNSTSKENR
jgi:hypothetical protein